MSKTLSIPEMVLKIVGPICPVGDSNIDAMRYDHLREMTSLVNCLLTEIILVAQMIHSPEASVHRSAEYAQDFLDGIRE